MLTSFISSLSQEVKRNRSILLHWLYQRLPRVVKELREKDGWGDRMDFWGWVVTKKWRMKESVHGAKCERLRKKKETARKSGPNLSV